MNNIKTIILILIVGTNILTTLYIKKHPEKISGFKLGNTPEEKKKGNEWMRLLSKSIWYANIITTTAGIISIYAGNTFAYIISLTLPVIVAVIFAYAKMEDTNRSDIEFSRNTAIVSASIVCSCFIGGGIAVAYQCNRDLNLTLNATEIIIGGMYGDAIPYNEIKAISTISKLPTIKYRSNGFAAGHTRLGNFITEDNKHIILFTHSDSLYIHVITKNDKDFYMSHKQTEQTTKSYERIKLKLKKNEKAIK